MLACAVFLIYSSRGFYTSHESASVRYAKRSEGIGGGISQDRRIGCEWFTFSEHSNTKRAVSQTAVFAFRHVKLETSVLILVKGRALRDSFMISQLNEFIFQQD